MGGVCILSCAKKLFCSSFLKGTGPGLTVLLQYIYLFDRVKMKVW